MNLGLDTTSAASLVGPVIAAILALIGAIVAAALFFRPNRNNRFKGFMAKLNAHVNFQRFHMAAILKVLYVFTVLYAVINGLISLFTGGGLMGLVWLVLAPLGLRLVFEQALLLLSIREESADTNELLRRMQGLPLKNPPQAAQPSPATQPPMPPQGGRAARQAQPDNRYPQRPGGYSAQAGGYGGYPPMPPRAQGQQAGEYGMTQRYAPVRGGNYGNGYEAGGYDAPANVVRPTPADGTGRFPVVSLKDDKGK